MADTRIDETWSHLLIIMEAESGPLSQVAKELLGKGRELADQLGVWLMVYSQSPLPDEGKEMISYGADLVFRTAFSSEIPLSRRLLHEKNRVIHLIEARRPEIVLFPATDRSAALAARVAQHFRTGLVTGCTALNLDLTERRLLATQPRYAGKLFEEYTWPVQRPQMATLAAGAFPEGFPDPYREGRIEAFPD